jgi:hypothetical protein
MFVESLMNASRPLVLKELEDVATVLDSEAFAPSLVLMEKEGLPAGTSAAIRLVVGLYRKERVAQINHQRTMIVESGRARNFADAGRMCITYVQNRARMLKLLRHADAESIATLVGLGDTETGSTVDVHAALEVLLGFFDANPEASKLTVDTQMLDDGRRALAGITLEHADAIDASVAREFETQAMRDHNDELTRLLDLVMLVKEQVELRHHTVLHGLGLALLRSQAAESPKKEEPVGNEDSTADQAGETGFA